MELFAQFHKSRISVKKEDKAMNQDELLEKEMMQQAEKEQKKAQS